MTALGAADRSRVEEICQAALDCDPADRPSYVAAACRGDEVLRREVDDRPLTELNFVQNWLEE